MKNTALIPCKDVGGNMKCEIASITLEDSEWEKTTRLYAINPEDSDKIKKIFEKFDQEVPPADRFDQFEAIAASRRIQAMKIEPSVDIFISYED